MLLPHTQNLAPQAGSLNSNVQHNVDLSQYYRVASRMVRATEIVSKCNPNFSRVVCKTGRMRTRWSVARLSITLAASCTAITKLLHARLVCPSRRALIRAVATSDQSEVLLSKRDKASETGFGGSNGERRSTSQYSTHHHAQQLRPLRGRAVRAVRHVARRTLLPWRCCPLWCAAAQHTWISRSAVVPSP